MEFEKENDIMDQRQEMMDDAIDDVTGLEDEEEGEEVVKEVLDEIGIDLSQAVSLPRSANRVKSPVRLTTCLCRIPANCFSWVIHRAAFKKTPSRTARSLKQSEAGEVVATMMTYRPDSTDYENDSCVPRSLGISLASFNQYRAVTDACAQPRSWSNDGFEGHCDSASPILRHASLQVCVEA